MCTYVWCLCVCIHMYRSQVSSIYLHQFTDIQTHTLDKLVPYFHHYKDIHTHTLDKSVHICINTQIYIHIKLIAFELAAKFLRRGENPVQPRLCNAKTAILKRLKTGLPFGRDLRRPTQTQSALH